MSFEIGEETNGLFDYPSWRSILSYRLPIVTFVTPLMTYTNPYLCIIIMNLQKIKLTKCPVIRSKRQTVHFHTKISSNSETQKLDSWDPFNFETIRLSFWIVHLYPQIPSGFYSLDRLFWGTSIFLNHPVISVIPVYSKRYNIVHINVDHVISFTNESSVMTDQFHLDGPSTSIQWTVHFRMDPLIKTSLSVTQFFRIICQMILK